MSTIPAVVAALVTLARATLDQTAWQVIDGPPGVVTSTRDRVFLVGDDEITSVTEWNDLAAVTMDDRYSVPLRVSIALPGADTLPTCRVEALAAYEAVRDAVLASPGRNLGLGGQGVLEVVVAGCRVSQLAVENGRAVEVRFFAQVYAELT